MANLESEHQFEQVSAEFFKLKDKDLVPALMALVLRMGRRGRGLRNEKDAEEITDVIKEVALEPDSGRNGVVITSWPV